jgi:hypothetical protein
LVTDFEEKLNILNRAGEFPFGIHFVGNLMIMMRRVIVFLLLTETSGFADEIFAAAGIKRRYTPFGKFKMIGAIKPAFFRLTVRRLAEVFDVARFAPRVDGVDVDVGQRFL